ncbi:7673_t:CDS:2, partial [Racocetra persica]
YCATGNSSPQDPTTAALSLTPLLKQLQSSTTAFMYLCVDEATTEKRTLANILYKGEDGEGFEGEYADEFCVYVLEVENGDLSAARKWLIDNAPKNDDIKNYQCIKDNCLKNDYIKSYSELNWLLDTPYEIRSYAIRQYKSSYKTCKERYGNKFRMKFRSKKDTLQTLLVSARDINRLNGVCSFLKNIVVSESLPAIEKTLAVTLDKLGRFHFHVSIPLEVRENQTPVSGRIVALDPGVMTCYDPAGRVIEWGRGDFNRIVRLCKRHDKLQSDLYIKTGKEYKITRYLLRRKMCRIRFKIRNLIDELHYKLVKWLCDRYQTILIPTFETSNMVKRTRRKIGSKTARNMLTWSHYRFRMFLKHKACEYFDRNIIECDEVYTSQTCGNCGWVNKNLRGRKRLICVSCEINTDRDFNGAQSDVCLSLFTNVGFNFKGPSDIEELTANEVE